MVVSVTARSEPDLTKQFELEIDWRVVEKQLVQWSNFFQDGKKLRVEITFNYVDSTGQPRRGSKKASSSATQRMLSDLATETNAEKPMFRYDRRSMGIRMTKLTTSCRLPRGLGIDCSFQNHTRERLQIIGQTVELYSL